MSDINELQGQILACQIRNQQLQNAIRVLVSAHQSGDPWADRLAETLLCLMSEEPDHLAQQWLDHFAILAREIVAKNAEIQALQEEVQHLQGLATTDPLTGLVNRRAFQERFQGELSVLARGIPHPIEEMGERRRLPVMSLMVIDIDHFKSINDTYGHPAGDAVLIELARRMREELSHRPGDIVVRAGGEEFFVFWPTVGSDTATEKAARFCREVAAQLFRIPDGQGEERDIAVTVSIGIGTIEVTERLRFGDAHQWLSFVADKALYWAKQHGRNQAVHFDQIKGD